MLRDQVVPRVIKKKKAAITSRWRKIVGFVFFLLGFLSFLVFLINFVFFDKAFYFLIIIGGLSSAIWWFLEGRFAKIEDMQIDDDIIN